MAKSGQKRKRADKAKVQLKKRQADIKLPKGLNVTKAEVKTKTIVVQSQIKKADDEAGISAALTKKKLGIKDVLSKISNLSVSTRVDGLEGLLELVQDHSQLLESNPSLILSRLLPLLTEKEGKVRNPAIKILQAIFDSSSDCLEPLYEVVSVHLCCALSHIDISIQFGALRLLDTVIERVPELVRRHAGQILPNCLSQIAISGGSKLDAAALNDAVSNVRRRTEVISRIAKLFRILSSDVAQHASIKPARTVSFNEGGGNHFSLHRAVSDLVGLPGCHDDKKDQLGGFMSRLTPVLLDVWRECVGQANDGDSKRTKKGRAAVLDNVDILCHVTEALTLICRMNGSGDCKARILHEVVRRMFPIHGQKSFEETVSVNMNLCELYLAVRDVDDSGQIAEEMVEYLVGLLQSHVGEFKRHIRVGVEVALALDKRNVLLDHGLLDVKHQEVDGYVTACIKRKSDQHPKELVTHVAKSILSRRASEKHCEAATHLLKIQSQGFIQSLLAFMNNGLADVCKPEVCIALVIATRHSASLETRQTLRKHIQSLEKMDDYSRTFCENTLSAI